ncbi:hypothetical protein Bca101_065897 [Brassica carinata]
MIIEDERDLDAPIETGREAPPPEIQTSENDNIRFEEFLANKTLLLLCSVFSLSLYSWLLSSVVKVILHASDFSQRSSSDT